MATRIILFSAVMLCSAMAMNICSTSFQANDCLPAKYGSPVGADGQNCGAAPNPDIKWDNADIDITKIQSYTMVMTDPTGGNYWNHWVVKDIPANVFEIPEGVAGTANVPGTDFGNSWNPTGYGAPCGGDANTYRITVYAMSIKAVTIDPRTQRGNQIEEALQEQGLLGHATMNATYHRMQPTFCPAVAHVCDITGVVPPATTSSSTSSSTTGVPTTTTTSSTSGVVGTTTSDDSTSTTGASETTTPSSTTSGTTTGVETSTPVPATTTGENPTNNDESLASHEKASLALLGVLVIAQLL